jgi:hypothetical protein
VDMSTIYSDTVRRLVNWQLIKFVFVTLVGMMMNMSAKESEVVGKLGMQQ